jgi:hypothetical protein
MATMSSGRARPRRGRRCRRQTGAVVRGHGYWPWIDACVLSSVWRTVDSASCSRRRRSGKLGMVGCASRHVALHRDAVAARRVSAQVAACAGVRRREMQRRACVRALVVGHGAGRSARGASSRTAWRSTALSKRGWVRIDRQLGAEHEVAAPAIDKALLAEAVAGMMTAAAPARSHKPARNMPRLLSVAARPGGEHSITSRCRWPAPGQAVAPTRWHPPARAAVPVVVDLAI